MHASAGRGGVLPQVQVWELCLPFFFLPPSPSPKVKEDKEKMQGKEEEEERKEDLHVFTLCGKGGLH